jgi:hypothetical protein
MSWFAPAGRKGPARKRHGVSASKPAALAERPIQRANIELLEGLGCYAVHIPNGSHLAGDIVARAKQTAALKKDGVRPGFPDLLVIDRRAPRIGVIEVKREGRETLDPDQIWWRDELQRLGVPWALVNTPDGSAAALRIWGWR